MKRIVFFVCLLLLCLPSISEACREFHSVAVDDHGNVQAGAAVTVTDATTSAVVTLYGEKSCGTPIVNPILTNAVGDYQFFVKDGVFNITVSKVGYNTHVIRNIAIISQFGENVHNVSEYGTLDLCVATTGVIDQIGATPTTLVITQGTFCTVNKTAPATLNFVIEYPGTITVSTTKTLTLYDPGHLTAPSTAQIFIGPGAVAFTNGGTSYAAWWGAKGDGATSNTTALQAALNAGGRVRLGGGTYLHGPITVSKGRTHLVGEGKFTTILQFVPTANNQVALTLSTGINALLDQPTLRAFAMQSADTTNTKTAIQLVDIDSGIVEEIAIGPVGSWTGANSIGLQTKGRDSTAVRKMDIDADIPLRISVNPNNAISIDHFHFQDMNMVANANPVILIDDGVNLTNVTFDGYQAWVKGTYGLYWNDTTTSISSSELAIKGVRTEQGTSATAYSIYIAHNTVLQQLHVVDGYLDPTRKGIYLRKVQTSLIQTTAYGGTLEAFNYVGDSNIETIWFQNCFFQVNSTATLTNFMLYDSMGEMQANKPIPDTAYYVYSGAPFLSTQRRRIPVIATGSLPAANAAQDGLIVIEDNGAGDRNIVIYGGGQRFRLDGGAAF